jgi:hypothetical protein
MPKGRLLHSRAQLKSLPMPKPSTRLKEVIFLLLIAGILWLLIISFFGF